MNYTRITQERLEKSLDKIVEHLQEAKVNDREELIKDLMIRAEVLKRDFTKRQQNILLFIYTLSYSYGKEFAVVPHITDFEMICGVARNKVTQELNKLADMNVIECEKAGKGLYKILPPITWDAPYHRLYNDTRSRELFVLNAEHAEIDYDFRNMD